MRKLIFFIFLSTCFQVQAQEPDLCKRSTGPGDVKVYADPQLDSLTRPVVVYNEEEQPTIQGYRVQVFASGNRAEAQKLKSELSQLYPNQPVYLLYEPPYFKIRVGDIRSKLAAQKLLHELKLQYESVLLVPDKINFPALNAIE